MEKEVIYKPKELYDRSLKRQYHDASVKHFEELAKKSGVDPYLNEKHVKDYKQKKAEADALEKKANSMKGLGGFILAMAIIFGIAGIFFLIFGIIENFLWMIILGPICIALMAALMVIRFTVIKKIINQRMEALKEARSKENEAYALCVKDMEPLNNLFDWNAPATVMEGATPIIDLDPIFNNRRLQYLHDKFKMPYEDKDTSILGVLSGEIQGNPFILEKTISQKTLPKTWHGSLTISWTTTYRDSKGNLHTQTHTQTLHAEVTKPAPFYTRNTCLIYGNEAAPNLHFTRSPSGASNMNEKERQKAVEKGMKELVKKHEKNLSFTPMGNDEFDVFFGADDRDNEVEFRLLYTPLAQSNILSLIKDKEPYGDDFWMKKSGMITGVASTHSQHFDYSANPDLFKGYDYKEMKERFVNYLDTFIKNLFFDLAPILSVPLYQIHKPHEFIFQTEYPSNITSYEQEVLANSFRTEFFTPKEAGSDLPLIIKAQKTVKDGKTDNVVMKAYSFKEIHHTDYIPKFGGDGKWHNVPVNWIEYIYVEKDTPMQIREVGGSKPQYVQQLHDINSRLLQYVGKYGKCSFQRGLLAIVNMGGSNDSALGNLFSQEEK